MRTLLIHGARLAMVAAAKKKDKNSKCITWLKERNRIQQSSG